MLVEDLIKELEKLLGDEISIERIENMRISNKEKICDYYII